MKKRFIFCFCDDCDFSVPSVSQAQDHPHDCDKQDHEDQATNYWQEGMTQHIAMIQKHVVMIQ